MPRLLSRHSTVYAPPKTDWAVSGTPIPQSTQSPSLTCPIAVVRSSSVFLPWTNVDNYWECSIEVADSLREYEGKFTHCNCKKDAEMASRKHKFNDSHMQEEAVALLEYNQKWMKILGYAPLPKDLESFPDRPIPLSNITFDDIPWPICKFSQRVMLDDEDFQFTKESVVHFLYGKVAQKMYRQSRDWLEKRQKIYWNPAFIETNIKPNIAHENKEIGLALAGIISLYIYENAEDTSLEISRAKEKLYRAMIVHRDFRAKVLSTEAMKKQGKIAD